MGSTNKQWVSEPIAIIGLSCKYAGDASNPEKLWKMLAEGRDAWSEIPSSRFNPKGVYHPDSEKLSTTNVKGAHFLEEDVGLFDAAFFNYSAETASALDPQYRLQLESTYEALENAGLSMQSVAGSNTSVYAGVFTHDYHEGLIRDEDKLPRFLPIGTLSAMSSNRISHFFDLRGASMTVDTGCSTALVALHQAVLGLRAGEADMSIVSGCNLMLTPDVFKVFSSLGMLGPDGRSYAFDSRANGYGRGEGVGTIVIKRLGDALANRDPIRAVIRETYLNQDGKTETITSPSQAAQEALIRECYRRAGLNPRDTQYFEAHGTGTPTGDPIECRAIASVFGADRDEKLRIGSVKTNIGHTEAASGLAGLIKVVLAMENAKIPPSVNFEKPNPKLKIDEWGLKVTTELEPWTTTDDGPRRASVNNFGYGGTNSHVIVEDGRAWTTPTPIQMNLGFHVGDRSEVLLFYGRDEQACRRMLSDAKEYLRRRKEEDADMGVKGVVTLMKSLCWTLSKRRTRFPWVSAHATPYSDNLDQVIKGLDAPQFKPVRLPSRPPRIGMVFTGQGAQWHAMGRDLINAFPIYRSTLFAAERCLRRLGADWSLMEELGRDQASSRVNDTALSIPICVAVQIALVRLLRFWGISPTAVTSHSSGEIAAAYTAGALTLGQAMAAAYYRAAMAADKKLMNSSGPKGAMVAVGVGSDAAHDYLDRITSSNGKAVVACINSPSSITIAGDEAAVQEIEELAVADGVFARRLRVDTGYHSHHMMPIAEPYRQALRAAMNDSTLGHDENLVSAQEAPEQMHWAEPYRAAVRTALDVEAHTLSTQGTVAFSSPVTGGRITRLERLADAEHWVDSLLQPVQFVDAFTDMVLGDMDESGTSVDVILEVGPHTALGGPVKEILSEPEFEGLDVAYMGCLVRNEDSRDTMRTAALNLLRRGLRINQANISFPWGQWPFDQRVLTDLPSYPWNHSIKHWSEARENKAYRQRDQEPHDLLGQLVPGGNPDAVCWKQVVRVSENAWLRDHVVQGHILYPGAGFVCLAVEGIKQWTDMSNAGNDEENIKTISGYTLRDVEMLQALVVPDNAEGVEVHTVIRPVDDKAIGARGWKQFDVSSVTADNQWTQHAKGLITVEVDGAPPPAPTASFLTDSGYTRRVDPEDMFANLRAKGLNHGPLFQNTRSIVQDGKSNEARCVTMIEVADVGRKGKHVLHPTTLDSVFISSYAALPGAGASDDSPKVPRSIQKLWVSTEMSTAAGHQFTCNTKLPHRDARTYEAHVLVVDGAHMQTVLEMQGFVGQSLGQQADAGDKQPWTKEWCAEVEWAPDMALSLGLPGGLPAIKKKLSLAREMDPRDRDVLMALRRVCVYFCHDALQTLTAQDVAGLAPHHVKFYEWMQRTVGLAAARRLGTDSDTWTSDPPQKRQHYTALAAAESVDGELICQLGPVLVPMLRGERAPLEVMMEGRLLYKYYANAFRMGPAFAQFTSLLHAIAHKNPRARVLEIGAGTGAATRHALATTRQSHKKESGPPCETWHFTDISSGFFEAARSEFAAWGNLLEYDRLDIEQDPEAQGFRLASYDIVVACQVLHATKSMARTMDHVHRLMKPGATLLLMETTQDQVDLQFIFGLLPGWWLSEEPERKFSPSLSVPLWDKVLKGAGFSGIDIELRDCETDDDMYSISNMLSTAPARPFKLSSDSVVVVINGKAPPPAAWLESLRGTIAKMGSGGPLPAVQRLEDPSVTAETYSTKVCVFVGELDGPVLDALDAPRLQGIKNMATGCKGLLWITRGAAVECVNPDLALAIGFLRVLRSEYVGRRFPALDLDPHTPVWSEPGITAIVHVLQACLGTPDDVYSITAEAAPVESEYAVRDGLILVPRVFKDLVRNKMLTPDAPDWANPESLAEAPLFQEDRPLRLQVGIPGLLDTLAFDDDKLADLGGDDLVEIEPRAYGLNFRDVMVAMGQLRERVMGLECAGVITRVGSEAAAQGFAVGDSVMALLLGPFGSRARISWHGVAHMPQGMSFEDAASLPMIFSTAYVSLVDIARLHRGQSVLIHAAAGGVGQAAIMLAKDYLGAEVYATVGSQEKRDLLTREYGIPPERIFNSRDASFAPAVLAATGGRGVDVVLNSLAGPLLQAGFDALAPFGHFVEIGKRDLEGNSLLEMQTFSRCASFSSLDMMSLLRDRGPHAHRVLSEIARLAGQKAIGPARPVTVFSMNQVSRAFRLLQTGRHTGKVVLSVQPGEEQVRVLPRAPTPKLRSDASYLLIGGIGGLGRSIAHWMVDHGARNLILLSRSAGKQDAGSFVTHLREAGCRVAAISCDVADKKALDGALDACERHQGFPPVRGVIQGAMVLQDSILEQMSLDDWQTAIRPKVAGSWNLHARFNQPGSLDFFVMLSSLSCILGWASQSNYAAGGSYQDALARYRQAAGLPGVSIDIGTVQGVGYVAESRVVSDRLRKSARSLMLPEDVVLRAIGAAVLHPLDQPQTLLGLNSGPGPHWDPASDSQMGRDARFVPLKYRRPPNAQAGSQQLDGADGGAKPLSAQLREVGSRDEATRLVGDAIATKLSDIFMISTDDIDLAKPPALYGVDSLVAVELRNMLMLQAASDVSIFSILQSVSLAALASDVVAKSAHVGIAA